MTARIVSGDREGQFLSFSWRCARCRARRMVRFINDRPRHDIGGVMTEQKKITATVLGEKQLDTFAVMCALSGRRAHELVNDLVLDAIQASQRDPEVQRIVRDMKRHRYGIHIERQASS